MAVKAVQQIMLGTVSKTEAQAAKTLQKIKAAGYDGIELNGFMIRPTSFLVRTLTKAAGMPTGKGGNYNWESLVKNAGLSVVSIHEDLGSIERDPKAVIAEAKKFGTDKIVITGMYRFDYRSQTNVEQLCKRLNESGKVLAQEGISLCYHNHNIELQKVSPDLTAMEYLIQNTDPEYLSFELDTYWPAEAGVDVLGLMGRVGTRMKLYHINDRGTKLTKAPITPILKSDSCERGEGNMPWTKLLEQALSVDVAAIILESHKNWLDNSPIRSLERSAIFLNKYVK